MELTQEEIYEALGLAMQKIEAAGASVALTDAVVIVGNIRSAVGNRWNRPSADYARMVREKLSPRPDVDAAKKALKPVIDYVQSVKSHVPIDVVVHALQVREALDGANVGSEPRRKDASPKL